MSKRKIAVPIKIRVIINEPWNQRRAAFTTKSSAADFSADMLRNHDVISMMCTLQYSDDATNEFYFTTTAELKRMLDIFLEPELLDSLRKSGLIKKEYIA